MAPILEVKANVAHGEPVDPEPGVAITTPLSTERCSTMVQLTLEKTVAQGLGVFSPHFIPMGTLIVTERAAVVGPKPSSPAHVCLECTTVLENLSELKKCVSCGLPLCRDCHSDSEKSLSRHRQECQIFTNVRSKRPEVIAAFLTDHKRLMALITPLRLLLKADTEPSLLDLESMEEERKNTLLFHLNEKNVTKVITDVLGLADQFQPQVIHKACGILDTNAYEVQCSQGSAARGLFLSISRINHSCIPNVRHFSTVAGADDGMKLTIKAARDILPGEQILVAYTPPFICTPLRRMILKQTKCFECKCSRCVDPSENGSFLSALKCKSCAEGKLLLKTPFDSKSDYACDSCDNLVAGSTCSMMIDTAMKFLGKGQGKNKGDSCPTETIGLMDHLSRFVSPSHQLIVDLKLRLIDQTVQETFDYSGDVEAVREKLLQILKETLIQCCKVAPGQSKARAKLSKQYHHLKEKFHLTLEERKDLDLMVLSPEILAIMSEEMQRDDAI